MPKDKLSYWYGKGDSYLHEGRYLDAVQAYKKALQLDPSLAAVWNNMGIALEGIESYKEAIDAYHQGLELDPTFSELWSNVGNALDEVGLYQIAILCYEKAL
jgi:superkiller protein 3